MGTFYLEDEAVEFEPGETLLRAALRAGHEIPHYCFHPGLAVTAQCRQCLVEITDMGNGRGMPRLQASCSTPAAEGMRITQTSGMAVEGQKLVNEFLLVNHPLDCPICDQAGECELQNTAFRYGSGHSEMAYEKRVYGWRDVGSFIVLERNRCIQCSLCERFSRDIVGTHDFAAFLRSHELTFDTWTDSQIAHKFQGNLADICPVGSILNRDWRFKKRAWKLQKTNTICPGCSTGCNVTVEQHQNRVFRIKPRTNHEVNRWWMCDEGRLGYKILNNRRDRIVEPLARVKGQLRSAEWEAAEQAIAQRLEEIGAKGDAVIALTDTHATNEELYLLREFLSAGLESQTLYFPLDSGAQQEQPPRNLEDPFIYSLITTDKSPNTHGAEAAGLSGDRDASQVKAALKKKPRAVFVLGAPFADNKEVRDLAGKAELVVVIGAFPGEWRDVADVLLPGFTHAEKEGTWFNRNGRLQRIAPGLTPPEMARDQLTILASLLAAVRGENGKEGENKGIRSAREVFAEMAEAGGPCQGLSWEDVGEGGIEPGSAGRKQSA